ncbi:hypothetical protein XELAEV_18000342mg [Xenopus laevis]|uniref:CCHC-type domain-containing protein n=1 Tax=Xenopus laevis TaxID=8355 RepID=A0A974BQK7_XENLA|nr:hypothetical protein XELAEV_18000342mg [Xenopus laevis]
MFASQPFTDKSMSGQDLSFSSPTPVPAVEKLCWEEDKECHCPDCKQEIKPLHMFASQPFTDKSMSGQDLSFSSPTPAPAVEKLCWEEDKECHCPDCKPKEKPGENISPRQDSSMWKNIKCPFLAQLLKPLPENQRRKDKKNIRCYVCGVCGHKARHCWSLNM